MTGLTMRWRLAIPLILLASLAIAAACGSGNGADDSGPDAEPLPSVTPTDTASFLALLDELELDWVMPEIALQRDWAEQGGSLIQITDPRSEWELYEFSDAASLDRFVNSARAGEVADLPVDAFGWTSDGVVVFLRAAEQSPETVQRFVSLFGEPILATGSAVVIVEPTEESVEPEPIDTVGESGPRPARPPDAVVAVGAEAVRVGIGTYCWTGTNEAICADSIGLITGLGTLNVSRFEPFVFQAELDWDTARQINVRAWSQDAAEELGAGDDWRAWSKRGEGIALPFAVSGGQLRLSADLTPGAYIVGASVFVEDGDVSYGFLLNVEGDPSNVGDDATTTDPGSGPGPTSSVIEPGAAFVLAPGGTAISLDRAIQVTLIEVRDDSRCPIDANCVWAGEVTVELAIETSASEGTRSVALTLPGDSSSTTVDGYTITFLALTPDPTVGAILDSLDYRATFTAQTDSTKPDDPGFEQVRVPAPIDAVEINVAESFPVQYFVAIRSGLPSGCATFDRVETSVGDDEIRIDVWNLEPAPTEPIACTEIYGIVHNNVALGSDFESGREYTVIVNGKDWATFVTQ